MRGFETLAGFVLSRLQKIPTEGDSFEYEGRRYVVEDGRPSHATVKIEPVAVPVKQWRRC
jgi:CBS domain containing-hemolysin-like protein